VAYKDLNFLILFFMRQGFGPMNARLTAALVQIVVFKIQNIIMILHKMENVHTIVLMSFL